MESFKISETFSVKPEKIYKAWMDSKLHSAFTGSIAEIDPVINGKYTAWDGYISGTTIELIPNKKIVQKWRTTEFSETSPDSLLEIILEEVKDGTELTLIHSDIPDGQADDYKQGWKDFYFKSLKNFLNLKS